MFRPIQAIIRFTSERVLVLIRFILLCKDGEISSSVFCNYRTPPQPRLLIVVIIKITDDEISPSLHNSINLINTNILSDLNLIMAGIG